MIFSTRRDRERVARLTREHEQARALADDAVDAGDRRRYDVRAARLARQAQLARTFPFGIWLSLACVLGPLLVWALLKRAGHGGAGVAAGLMLAAAELAIAVSRR